MQYESAGTRISMRSVVLYLNSGMFFHTIIENYFFIILAYERFIMKTEKSHISIPFTPSSKPTKKKSRRAVYITIQCGHRVMESELFVITSESIEVRFTDRLKLDSVAPDFVVVVQGIRLLLRRNSRLTLSL